MDFVPHWATGFEIGTAPPGLTMETGWSIHSPQAKTGTYCLRFNRNVSASCYINIPDATNDMYMGVWVNTAGVWSGLGSCYVRFYINSAHYCEARLNTTTGYWNGYVNGVLVHEGTIQTAAGYTHVQLHLKVADSGGIFQTRINGLLDCDYTGDTKPGATDIVSRVYFLGSSNSTSYYRNLYFDDLCIGTVAWPGDLRFDPLLLDGDDSVQWDGSDGNQVDNWALIDERGPSDADYVVSDVTGEKDKYTIGDWVSTNKIPVYVQIWVRAKGEGLNSHQLKVILDDGTEDEGTPFDLAGGAYGYHIRQIYTPPSGGGWSDAVIDGLKLAIESVIT